MQFDPNESEVIRSIMYSDVSLIDPEEYIIATYLVKATKYPPMTVAEEAAIENSTGTWTLVKYETLDVREMYGAKILQMFKACDGTYVLQLGIKAENYDPETGGISNLLADIAGNAYDLMYIDRLKLMDLTFPKWWEEAFPGPKYGVEGLRKLTRTEGTKRPLVGTIIKPNVGLDARTIGKMVYEVGLGGLDFVKDDEALVNPKYCRLEDRVSAVVEAIDKVKEETGKEILYAFNITMDNHSKMLDAADLVLDNGGNHLMIVLPYVGYGGLRLLAESDIKAPIHVHRCGHGAYTMVEDHGFSPVLVSKLARMCGADEIHCGSVEGKFHYDPIEVRRNVAVLRGPWGKFKATMPVSSAGNHPGNVPANVRLMGVDILILAGGGVFGHPLGFTAGAKAMLQAAEAISKGISLEEYAKDHEELKAAVEKWGIKEDYSRVPR